MKSSLSLSNKQINDEHVYTLIYCLFQTSYIYICRIQFLMEVTIPCTSKLPCITNNINAMPQGYIHGHYNYTKPSSFSLIYCHKHKANHPQSTIARPFDLAAMYTYSRWFMFSKFYISGSYLLIQSLLSIYLFFNKHISNASNLAVLVSLIFFNVWWKTMAINLSLIIILLLELTQGLNKLHAHVFMHFRRPFKVKEYVSGVVT